MFCHLGFPQLQTEQGNPLFICMSVTLSSTPPCLSELLTCCIAVLQIVKLLDVFPHGTGFVLVFEYMLSDLSEVMRNVDKPLTEVSVDALPIALIWHFVLFRLR